MSTLVLRRHDKQSIDRAIGRAYARLRAQPRVRRTFARLLEVVHERSALLRTRTEADGHHVSIDALCNLAIFWREHERAPQGWTGAHGHVVGVIGSLARHLFGGYPTPHFLGSVWLGSNASLDREQRWWFVRHTRGLPFRRVGLPMVMTRAMEHHFLRSPDHLPVLHALRRAEVLGLGGRAALANAIASTPLGRTLDRAEYWRAVIERLVACASELELARLPQLIDYLATFDELPRQPIAELLAASERLRGTAIAGRLAWRRSRWHDQVWPAGLDGLAFDERWSIVELLDSRELAAEGRAMAHCVGSYAWRCHAGRSSIWSLRREADGRIASMLTIEVDPRSRTIVQIRGPANERRITAGHALLRAWAAREELTIASSA